MVRARAVFFNGIGQVSPFFAELVSAGRQHEILPISAEVYMVINVLQLLHGPDRQAVLTSVVQSWSATSWPTCAEVLRDVVHGRNAKTSNDSLVVALVRS